MDGWLSYVLIPPLVLKSDKPKQDRTLLAQAMDGSNNNTMRGGRKLFKGKVIGGEEIESNFYAFLSEV